MRLFICLPTHSDSLILVMSTCDATFKDRIPAMRSSKQKPAKYLSKWRELSLLFVCSQDRESRTGARLAGILGTPCMRRHQALALHLESLRLLEDCQNPGCTQACKWIRMVEKERERKRLETERRIDVGRMRHAPYEGKTLARARTHTHTHSFCVLD